MDIYRVRCYPRGAWITPWQADTLFGQLCWIVRYCEGEDALHAFLEPFLAGRPPFVLSNGFPGDLLPRPVLPAEFRPGPKGEVVASMKAAKAMKAQRLVSPEVFQAIRSGQTGALAASVGRAPGGQEAPGPLVGVHAEIVLKNQINRISSTTTPPEGSSDAEGNLYAREESSLPEGWPITVYVAADSQASALRAHTLLLELSRGGYGAKKSSGYGAFEVADLEDVPFMNALIEGANAFVSLSNFVPAADDPVEGYYQTLVKYGKLGEEFATTAALSPFKFPLLMVQAGAVFRDPTPRPWYGRMVRGVHPSDERIVQCGYALALPLRLNVL